MDYQHCYLFQSDALGSGVRFASAAYVVTVAAVVIHHRYLAGFVGPASGSYRNAAYCPVAVSGFVSDLYVAGENFLTEVVLVSVTMAADLDASSVGYRVHVHDHVHGHGHVHVHDGYDAYGGYLHDAHSDLSSTLTSRPSLSLSSYHFSPDWPSP